MILHFIEVRFVSGYMIKLIRKVLKMKNAIFSITNKQDRQGNQDKYYEIFHNTPKSVLIMLLPTLCFLLYSF